MEYAVTITRESYCTKTFYVASASPEAAEETALQLAHDTVFDNPQNAEYKIVSTEPNKSDLLEELIEKARQHGEDSEPDHEVGDLQDILRAAFDKLPTDKQQALYDEFKDNV